MADRVRNVLILCTGNSARSILGEVLVGKLGQGRFRGFSAGSHPKGAVHPMALKVLDEMGYQASGVRSKSWDEFAGGGGPEMDIVITVCDSAAGETCPVWLGHPVMAHWGIPDPAAVEGEGQRDAFLAAYEALSRRIARLVSLPVGKLDEVELSKNLQAIHDQEGAA